MIFEYATLQIIWWHLISLLIIGFAITGGMDLGVNMLLIPLGKTNDERRLILNSVGPTWEGNQVWLITFGATLFAIWPQVYASAFSSLYYALFLALLMLILRPPGFDYRAKINSNSWRNFWDYTLFIGSCILSLVFGVAVANLFIGFPFSFDSDLRLIYTGGFFDLFSPLSILFGLVSIGMLLMQGSLYLQYKLPTEMQDRAKTAALIGCILFVFSFIACGPTLYFQRPASFNNYFENQYLWSLPILSIILAKLALILSQKHKSVSALVASSGAIIATILTAACALFPYTLVSSSHPAQSLTIWNASSSHLTLEITLIALIVFLPVVLLYTIWVYLVMRGKVELQTNSY